MPPQTPHDPVHIKSEVVWLPAATALLASQLVFLSRGLRTGLPPDVPAVYIGSLVLVAASVVSLVLALLVDSRLLKTLALITLVLGVAADMFVATSAVTGGVPQSVA